MTEQTREEKLKQRWQPGGDKYEAMKADEIWEKANEPLPFADDEDDEEEI